MTYILPHVSIYQDYQRVASSSVPVLRTCIVGGNAVTFRYAEASERPSALLGSYVPGADTDYEWPSRPTGGIVDQSFFKLWAEEPLLQYYNNAVDVSDIVAPVANYKNRVRAASTTFRATTFRGVNYALSAIFQGRDVQVGDVVDVAGQVSNVSYSVRATVTGFVGEPVAATRGAATTDSGNAATQIAASPVVTQIAGTENCVTATASSGSYDGTPDGDINETYTVTVTQASTDGDLTTALLRVRSASGHDDADDVASSGAGIATAIGARGLTMTFAVESGCENSTPLQTYSAYDLLLGQTWTIVVRQAFTAPTATSGGTYTGPYDTSYVVEVIRGGLFTDPDNLPQIRVTSLHGVDFSGPTDVTAFAAAASVGSYGVTITFASGGANSKLCGGDVYYIAVAAAGEGANKTLLLSKNLPDELAAATDLDLTLYVRGATQQIPYEREDSPPNTSYVLGTPGVTDTGFTVNAGITLPVTWAATTRYLPIAEATLYAEYRAWVSTMAGTLNGLTSDADFDDIPGAQDPDNPLKYGVHCAWALSSGQSVKYIAVADPTDITSWEAAIERLVGQRSFRQVVPMTHDAAVIELFKAFTLAQSGPDVACFKSLWTGLQVDQTKVIADAANSEDGEVLLMAVSDDPDVAGNQYTIVNVPAGNAQFTTLGVRAGDTLRYNYATDAWGRVTYDEYVIDAVINEDTLRLRTGQGTAVQPVARRGEVWRTMARTEYAQAIAAAGGAFGHRRFIAVWPDTIRSGSQDIDNMYVAAALAGQRSGSWPHQSLTNAEFPLFDSVPRTTDLFNADQLDIMANAGVWIVTAAEDGTMYTRHGLTTAGYGELVDQEETIGANSDAISWTYVADVQDLIGKANITPHIKDLVSLRLESSIAKLMSIQTANLGGQLIAGNVESITQHEVMRDRLDVVVVNTQPSPLNNLVIRQSIII